MGITDKEILEYHWGDRLDGVGLVGDRPAAGSTVEYNLKPEGEDRTRVRFDITLELARARPRLPVKRAKKHGWLDVATERLRERVMASRDCP